MKAPGHLTPSSRFEKHRFLLVLALIFVVLPLVALTTDILVTTFFIYAKQGSQRLRVSSPIYHHELLPSAYQVDKYGPSLYDLYTNSMGFKDGTSRVISKTDPD